VEMRDLFFAKENSRACFCLLLHLLKLWDARGNVHWKMFTVWGNFLVFPLNKQKIIVACFQA